MSRPRIGGPIVDRDVAITGAERHPRLVVDEDHAVLDRDRLDRRLRRRMGEAAEERRTHARENVTGGVSRADANEPLALRVVEGLHGEEGDVEFTQQEICEVAAQVFGDLLPLGLNRGETSRYVLSLQNLTIAGLQNFQAHGCKLLDGGKWQSEVHTHELLLLRAQIERAELQIDR